MSITPSGGRPLKALLSFLAGSLVLLGDERASDPSSGAVEGLRLDPRGLLSAPGLDVLVFNNVYEGLFSDAKISGVELIHHDVRTATNGDVRLSPTPGQWDPIPRLVSRRLLPAENAVEVVMEYPEHSFQFVVRTEAAGQAVRLSVNLPAPLPKSLVGRAGFNLEFLPSAYCRKTFLADGKGGLFPLYPSCGMRALPGGGTEPLPLVTASTLVLAPEDEDRRVTLSAGGGALLSLFDGRAQAQNGWFVVRSELPPERSGRVLEWTLSASRIQDWRRPHVIGHSQVGYAPSAPKVAVIETDARHKPVSPARLLRLAADGRTREVLEVKPELCAPYLRYAHLRVDFSEVREPGLYLLEYDGVRTRPFRIASDVYADAWHASLGVFLPVQMDHMQVNEAYRVWHADSHRDDARQAPVNHEHFDLYRQGPTTDTAFAPGEHIPGLNVGGWYDAGDFDLRTQTQYSLVLSLVQTWEDFRPLRDTTSVDHVQRRVELHVPDGVPDLVQQVRHGALALLAQFRAVGHAINGIVEPDLGQYTHLGDGASKTDGLVFDPRLAPGERRDGQGGTPDDRWAFTNHSTPLNYGSAAALAAASRALRGFDEAMAEECLVTALRVWDEEHSRPPRLFSHGNTTGGDLAEEEFKAAAELLRCTGESRFATRVGELLDEVGAQFGRTGVQLLRLLPAMPADFAARVETLALRHRERTAADEARRNPYRAPITGGAWAGSGRVIHQGILNYHLHRAFPGHFGTGELFACLDYLYGCHPGHNLSLVSGVGLASKEVAYGNNRADFSFIAGGVVPGVLLLKPDFPENKEDWPFFWGQNEYVVDLAGSHLYLAHAADALCRR